MKKRNVYIVSVVTVLLLLTFACNSCSGIATGFNKVAEAITNPTAREVYAREFKDNQPIFDAWEAAYKASLADSLEVTLPYGEKGAFRGGQNTVYSYTVQLQEGEVLHAEAVADSLHQRIFMDVYAWDGTGWEKAGTNDPSHPLIAHPVQNSGAYKLVIQPEIAANSAFFISINKKPMYGFPVAGKGNAAIMSFWGMERDGGVRKHEGIDIFAKKGTPVVAATDGTIGFTGERGIGGKQVWLREGLFGNSLYYAHLDGIAVESGARVKAGDTLGYVGNTGNAQFTPPHLHFGIYKNGAVNPLPFVYETDNVSPAQFPKTFKEGVQKVKGKANLRKGPATTFGAVGALTANDTVMILGQAKDWLHVQTSAGQKAFLHKSLVK